MTEKTVQAETTQIEEATIRFCDACGNPVGGEYGEYEELYRNPRATTDKSAIHRAQNRANRRLEHAVHKAESGLTRIEKREYRTIGDLNPRKGEVTRLVGVNGIDLSNLKEIATLEHDGSVDVCHDCLKERFSGPELSAYETLEIDNSSTSDGDDDRIPIISLSLYLTDIVVPLWLTGFLVSATAVVLESWPLMILGAGMVVLAMVIDSLL